MRSFEIYRAFFWSNIIRMTKPRWMGSAGNVAQRRKKLQTDCAGRVLVLVPLIFVKYGKIKATDCGVETPCSVVKIYQCFGKT